MAERTCSVPTCEKRAHARGWCIGHYQRWRTTGEPGGPLRPHTRPAEERFWEKVQRGGPDDCWLWTGNITKKKDPHGRFYPGPGREGVLAHRYAYELLVGPIPEGMHIDHLCRTRLCVNPRHLEPVTPKVNALRGVGVTALNATKTRCDNGHPLGPDRRCGECDRARKRAWAAKKHDDPEYRERRRAQARERYRRGKESVDGR